MSGAAFDAIWLRPATPSDMDFLLELRRETMSHHQAASGIEPSSLERFERVMYRFECAQIIMQRQTPVGLWKVARDDKAWQLIQIQLAPTLQGLGIGAGLIRALITEAERASASLTLTVLKANPARQLYERLGFRVVGETPHGYELRVL